MFLLVNKLISCEVRFYLLTKIMIKATAANTTIAAISVVRETKDLPVCAGPVCGASSIGFSSVNLITLLKLHN